MKKGLSRVAAGIGLGLMTTSCASFNGAEREAISHELAEDGFTGEFRAFSDDKTEPAKGILKLGICEIRDVTADITFTDGVITNVGPYTAPVLTVGEGKFRRYGVVVEFANATDFRNILTEVNCFPE